MSVTTLAGYTRGNTLKTVDDYLANAEGVTASATANANATHASALALTSEINRVNVVTATNNGVSLPTPVEGARLFVVNGDSADAMNVYGAGTSTVNGVATDTGVSQAAGVSALYVATSNAAYYRILSA